MCELWVTSGCVERPAPAYITLYTLWLSSDFYDMISECANHGPAGRHDAGAPQLARVTPPAPPRSLHGSLLSSISVPLAPVAQPQLASTDPVPRVRSSPRISVMADRRVFTTPRGSAEASAVAPRALFTLVRVTLLVWSLEYLGSIQSRAALSTSMYGLSAHSPFGSEV